MNRLEKLHDAQLTIDGYIDVTFKEVKKNIGSLAILFGLFYIVVPLVTILLSVLPFTEQFTELGEALTAYSQLTEPPDPEQVVEVFMPLISKIIVPLSVIFTVISIAFIWLSLATAVLIERSILGKPVNAFKALGKTLSKVPLVIVVGLIIALAFILGFIVLSLVTIVPGAYFEMFLLPLVGAIAMVVFV
ncbi:MAG: hypothetical protein AAF889_05495, partial [Cyanobacteria bacterium P01_D01_bin.73]